MNRESKIRLYKKGLRSKINTLQNSINFSQEMIEAYSSSNSNQKNKRTYEFTKAHDEVELRHLKEDLQKLEDKND